MFLSLYPVWYFQKLFDLKVRKREIFDDSDFPDFYTMKSLRGGDFGVRIKNLFNKYLGVHLGVQSSLRVCSVYFKEVFFLSWGQKNFFLGSY
jgi:hypothetical protein